MIFKNPKNIVYFSKNTMFLRDQKGTVKPIEPKTLEIYLNKLPDSDWLFILGKEYIYNVRWHSNQPSESRSQVKDNLKKFIPEEFADNQFDWRMNSKGDIETIVITGEFFHQLLAMQTRFPQYRFSIISATALIWELGNSQVTSESDPKLLNFAAQKKQEGSDTKNLIINLNTSHRDLKLSPTSLNSNQTTPPSFLPHRNIILSLAAILLFAATGALWITYFGYKPDFQTLPLGSPAASPIETAAVMNLNDYHVLLQYPKDSKDEADSIAAKLQALGFSQIDLESDPDPSTSSAVYTSEPLNNNVGNLISATIADTRISFQENKSIIDNRNKIIIKLGIK